MVLKYKVVAIEVKAALISSNISINSLAILTEETSKLLIVNPVFVRGLIIVFIIVYGEDVEQYAANGPGGTQNRYRHKLHDDN